VRLDIVMPAHNEEDRIDRTLRAYRAACPDDGVRFLVALDSCTDRTPEIVDGHERADARVRSFEYPKLGKGGVIAETFRRSDADLVGSSTPTAPRRRASCCASRTRPAASTAPSLRAGIPPRCSPPGARSLARSPAPASRAASAC
jgi:cellulose synthase/poly-beta-1,6-N-acetylglucosamine synthase-like glycosyltransferase